MSARVLLVGVGGLGCPVASALAQRGPAAAPVSLTLLDDDVVDATNLHRQTLYTEADIGALKVERAASRLLALAAVTGTRLTVEPCAQRLTPADARALVARHELIVEGADNLPTKFLAADAAALERRPIVQAGAVRWSGWVKAAAPGRGACLRCIFEDVPRDRVETCAEAGVVGALVGLVGALEAGLVVRLLEGDLSAVDTLTRIDARAGSVRTTRVRPRASCPLCGSEPLITDLSAERYVPACAL